MACPLAGICTDAGYSSPDENQRPCKESGEVIFADLPAGDEDIIPSKCFVPSACDDFENLRMHEGYSIYDINLADEDGLKKNLRRYFDFCMDPGMTLSVTTSCFPVWKQSNKTNGLAKIIPAVPSSMPGTRVFFFDDNINLNIGGGIDTEGICNLRDIQTAEFVDFNAGHNGFKNETLFKYTVVASSTEYNNVLVQANILDAMTHDDYFHSIITRYSKPGEKCIVFVDVNGTTVADDTITIKDVSQVLVATMFAFTDIRPRENDIPLEFEWKGKPPISIDGRISLRSIINKISKKDDVYYKAFWTQENCEAFLHKAASIADLVWQNDEAEKILDPADFLKEFSKNFELIQKSPMKDGIPQSWLSCYAALEAGRHHVIMNSFGVDTHRVIKQLVRDTRQVLQLTVNYRLWSERDTKLWNQQFEHKDEN